MRTTVDLDDALLTEARTLAQRTGRTLTSVLENGLRLLLARRPPRVSRARVRLPVSDRPPGLMPGVDLDSSASLLDIMDDPDAAH